MQNPTVAIPQQTVPAVSSLLKKPRNLGIDMARGIAIIAVVLGHTVNAGRNDFLFQFCFSFHMPLFFLVAGYFFTQTGVDKKFLVKNARTLLLPYVLTCAAIVFCACLSEFIFRWGPGVRQVFWQWFTNSLYGAGAMDNPLPDGIGMIGAPWFLLALFWARLFLAMAKSMPYTPVVVLGLFAAGYASATVFWLPLSVQAGLCATLWLYLGGKIKEARLLEPGVVPLPCWILMLALWVLDFCFFGHLFMVVNHYGAGPMDVVGGLCGSLVIIKGCMLIEHKAPHVSRALAALGVVTLTIFSTHSIEMAAIPWELLRPWLAWMPAELWVVDLILRSMVIALLCLLVYLLPRPVSGIFFPGRKAGRKGGRKAGHDARQ